MIDHNNDHRTVPRWITGMLIMAALWWSGTSAAMAQSRAGSRAGSAALAEGSALVTAGSAEILSGSASLVITSVKTTARGVRLIMRPVAAGVSNAAEVSAGVTVEISLAAPPGRALEASLVAVGDVIETIAISAVSASAATTIVVGSILVVNGVVLAVIAHEMLEAMLGHGVHGC